MRERWSEALIKRREYLEEQIKKIFNKSGWCLKHVSFLVFLVIVVYIQFNFCYEAVTAVHEDKCQIIAQRIYVYFTLKTN